MKMSRGSDFLISAAGLVETALVQTSCHLPCKFLILSELGDQMWSQTPQRFHIADYINPQLLNFNFE
jgi:hypothetical protein